MARKVIDLLRLVGGDAEEEVAVAVTRWRERVRENVRSITGFRLTESGAKKQQTTVPIRIAPGLPASLKEFGETEMPDDDQWAVELIGAWKHRIEEFAKAAKPFPTLVGEFGKVDGWSKSAEEYGSVLDAVDLMTSELLRQAQLATVLKKLMAIEDDILGAYFYKERVRLHGIEVYNTRIELYWLVIGALARLIGTPIESLTAVVLCHELAHAFSHVGRDIDGKTWSSSFAEAHKKTKEGVAQFYTERVMRKLKDQGYPELYTAYETLLRRQSGPYTCHVNWADYSPEVMREALLNIRRAQSPRDFTAFDEMLSKSHQHLA